MGCKAEGEVKYRSNLRVVRILTIPTTQSDRFFFATYRPLFLRYVLEHIRIRVVGLSVYDRNLLRGILTVMTRSAVVSAVSAPAVITTV